MNRLPLPTTTILRRELLTSLRSWKSFVLLLFLLLGLLFLAWQVIESAAWTGGTFAMRRFFQMQVWSLYAVAMAIVPAMAAVAVNSERESGNWELLVTTLIPPSRIILGKYLAVLAYFFLLCISVLPLVGLVYFYAGVDTYQLYDALVRIVPAALCNTALGLWVSQRYPSPAKAVINAFGLVFVYGVVFAVAGVLYNARLQYVPFAVALFQPFSAIRGELLFAAYQIALALFFLGLTLLGARQRKSSIEHSLRSAAERVRQSGGRLLPRRMVSVPDGANPFGYRDIMGAPSQNRAVAGAMAIGTFVLYGLIFLIVVDRAPGAEAGLGIVERIALLFVLPPLVAIAVVKEREATTLDMYRMTLLESSDFVRGKIAGVLRQLRPILVGYFLAKILVIGGQSMMTLHGNPSPPVLVLWLDLFSMPIHIVLVMAAGLMGAVFPRTLVASIGAASGTVFVSFFIFMYMHFEMLRGGRGGGGELAEIFAFSLMHLVLSLFAFIIAFGVAIARTTAFWGEPKQL